MATRSLPTPEELRKVLRYEPETGRFFWRERTQDMFTSSETRSALHKCRSWNANFAGKEAFTSIERNGYRQTTVNMNKVRAHRVAWAIMTGVWPSGEVDHINGIRDDNRWENLRDVSKTDNARNRRQPSKSKGPFMGVSQVQGGGWKARIKVDKKEIYIGKFLTKEEAISARKKAQKEFGFHPRHGEP